MKKAEKFIIDVIPLTRIPMTRNHHFSYLSKEKIPFGTLVSIPLFKRSIRGIVIQSRSDFHRLGNIKLREITSTDFTSLITENQMKIAEFVSQKYFCSLGIVLKSMAPKIIKKPRKEKTIETIHPEKKEIILTPEQNQAIQKISKTTKKVSLLFGPSGSGKTEIYLELIKKIKKDGQALILLPELTLTPQAIEGYGSLFPPDKIAVLNSKISKGKFYSDWEKIRSGEARIIIGSRMAVFAPFKNLALIVVDEEQDISHKQWDMAPRYDARTVAEELANIFGAKLVLGSASPRLESFHLANQKKYALAELPPLKISPPLSIELEDMKKVYWKKNKFPGASPISLIISSKLKSEIIYALRNNLQTILFVNRQGMSSFSICTDCKAVLKCPKCERALIYARDGTFHCLHCTYKTSPTPRCEKCQGLAFINLGTGTQKVEREIEKLFSKARIARVDQATMRVQGAQAKIYAEFSQGKIDILIGTQMISKGWDLPRVALVGIIDADNLLSLPDFWAYERAFQNIIQASGRVSRPGARFPGKVIIQTFNPESKFFQSVSQRDFLGFFQKEMEERKWLKIPPFGKIIKLVLQKNNLAEADKEIRHIFTELEKKSDKNTIIFEPQDAFIGKIRGRFRKQIIIKIPAKKNLNIPLKNFIQSLSSEWIIDVDPISII